ncbi:MAG: hypothetical protein KCHDKBKB_01709 [Elusimicrobia bacterium]|nr:hypothetical protein [Elusimicrobiota bacterium]
MPTILSKNGYRLFFYSNEGSEPPHVNVEYQGAVAKFWLNPVVLASNLGMSAHNVRKASGIVQQHETHIREKWNEFFSKKS